MKVLKLVIAAVFVTTAAFAQTPGPSSFKFEFPSATVQSIGQGLAKLPYEQAAPVLAELQRQIDAQIKPQSVPKLPPVSPPPDAKPEPKSEDGKPEEK